ncbi:hypothetical protein E2562_031947 [Oryza meyeriana var. granulata]|uniref:DUF834 domain-containing protein n=1 Tax=Oryza meyeriana var. granulata TaxID=110450 RepID=A0A6G1ERS9_9ORYZ|nr:hypothetical protein E2562_031947 [Oryza meyeriana var. granulata]
MAFGRGKSDDDSSLEQGTLGCSVGHRAGRLGCWVARRMHGARATACRGWGGSAGGTGWRQQGGGDARSGTATLNAAAAPARWRRRRRAKPGGGGGFGHGEVHRAPIGEGGGAGSSAARRGRRAPRVEDEGNTPAAVGFEEGYAEGGGLVAEEANLEQEWAQSSWRRGRDTAPLLGEVGEKETGGGGD